MIMHHKYLTQMTNKIVNSVIPINDLTCLRSSKELTIGPNEVYLTKFTLEIIDNTKLTDEDLKFLHFTPS